MHNDTDKLQEWIDEREHLRSELSLQIKEIARKHAYLPDH